MRLIDADILRFYLNTRFFHDVRDKDMVCETINAQPTIDPIRKGKWVDGRCSQCGGEAYWKGRRDVYGWSEFALELTKYCPNCGSLNEGEGD